MTLNNQVMKQNRECQQLDIAKKIKIKIDDKNRILYVNDYFTNITGYKVSDIILKELDTILDASMPKMTINKLEEIENQFEHSYFIFKGRTKDGDCYWSFSKITQRFNAQNEFEGYLIEGKTAPAAAVQKINKLYTVLKEIEDNAGIDAAVKYFNGFIEEKGMNFNEFILALAQVNEKKAEKYFEIDEDALAPKKKKRGWF